jgi:malate dehydrogenase
MSRHVMSTVAIIGAGPLGAAIAHKLAERGRIGGIRFVDANPAAAAGKALDIMQSGPIDHFETHLTATADPLGAVGADAIVFADDTASGEWQGEPGLARVQQLARAGTAAPIVFAGPGQTSLMEAAHTEVKIAADRLVGTAPSGLAGALRAVAAVELGLNGVDFAVGGRPPAFVIGWSSATIGGALVTDRVPAHRLVAISQSIRKLWPPAAQAVAAPTARILEGLILGSRKSHQALTILDGEFGVRRVAAVMPLRLGHGRVLDRLMPSLSPQERTQLINELKAEPVPGR